MIMKLIKINSLKFFPPFFLLILLLASIPLSAQKQGLVQGKCYDAQTKQVLNRVTLRILNSGFGTFTNKKGEFKITGLKDGEYTLLASIVGYESQKQVIQITNQSSFSIEFYLKESSLITSDVIVSANKTLQAVQDVPISISVIDSRQLKDRSINKIDDALQYVPGIAMNDDQVSIRGSSGVAIGVGSRVALLVDGIPILSGDQGDMKFDAIPVFNIDRIEVVKGAGSALYGSSALGGVINIITKEPEENLGFSLRASSGVYTKPTYEQWEYQDNLPLYSTAQTSLSFKNNGFKGILSLGYQNDQSYRQFDESIKWNFFSKIGFDLSAWTKLSFLTNYATDNRNDWVYWNSIDSATRPPTGTNLSDRLRSDKFFLSGYLKHIIDNFQFIDIKAGWFFTSLEPKLADMSNPRQTSANSFNTEFLYNYNKYENMNWTFGLNYTLNLVESKIYEDAQQYIVAAYTQLECSKIKDLIITAGCRFDIEKTSLTDDINYSPSEPGALNTGNLESNLQFSPKLGVSYNAAENTKLRFSIGSGFRSPTIGERFATIQYSGFSVVRNLSLKPERSLSIELGCNQELSLFEIPAVVDLSLFHNEFYDLIEPTFVNTTSANIQFQNIVRARVRGAELDFKAMLLENLGFETSLTAIDPINRKTNETLKYRSNWTWYTRLFYKLGDFELQADYRYLSKAKNLDDLLGSYVEDYDARVDVNVVDLHLIYNYDNPTFPLTFSLNCLNLFNYYYTKTPGNLAPTRFVGLQVDCRF